MARVAAVLAACLVVVATFATAEQLPKPSIPITQNDNKYYAMQNASLAGPPRYTYGTQDLPESSLPYPVNADSPDQVKLTLVSPTEVWVTFTTGMATNGTYNATTGPPKAPTPPFGKPSVVSYGTKAGKLKMSVNAGTPHTYTQTANNGSSLPVYYISPFLYLAKLQNLEPKTRYYYSIRNTANMNAAPTKEYTFKTQAPVGDDSPIVIAVIGDIGETYNTSDTLAHVAAQNPDLVYNMGDFSYADHYLNNNPVKWDIWGRLVSPVFSMAPHNPTNGNHELETGNGNNQGVADQSYNNRYPMPYEQAGSPSNLYYSIEHGPVHTVFLSQYTDYSKASTQYAWAQADLASIDRSKTPWVFVIFHGPVYHTYSTHYKQYDCFRQVWEPLFNSAGVDLCMSGHVHAYERSNPVNNYTTDPSGCAPTYITVGDGGNSEGLYHAYVDGNATDGTSSGTDGCPNPSDNDLSADPATCYSPKLQVPYCTPQQPSWSAYREDAFGHGILKIKDANTAKWTWYRNLDSIATVTDKVLLQRDTRACPNRRQGAVLAPKTPKATKAPKPTPAPTPAPTKKTKAPKTPAPTRKNKAPKGKAPKGKAPKHKTPAPKHGHDYEHVRYTKFGGKLYEWNGREYVQCKDGQHPK